MNTYYRLTTQLEQELHTLENKNPDLIPKTEQVVKLCKQVLVQLQEMVVQNGFSSTPEEIEFFKILKPGVVGKIIYYLEYLNIQSNCPNGLIKHKVKYLNNQISKLQKYYRNNIEFYYYYKQNAQHFDEQYFLRKNKTIRLRLEDYRFFMGPNFSTSHDGIWATMMGNEKLINKLQFEMNNLKPKNNMDKICNPFQKKSELKWTGEKIELIELIYALHASGSINNGKSNIKDLVEAFEHLFNIDLGDYSRAFTSIKHRKTGQIKFLDTIKEDLVRYINDIDEKGL